MGTLSTLRRAERLVPALLKPTAELAERYRIETGSCSMDPESATALREQIELALCAMTPVIAAALDKMVTERDNAIAGHGSLRAQLDLASRRAENAETACAHWLRWMREWRARAERAEAELASLKGVS